ncbi:MAG: tetratricopeptide repeat protein [Coleofasciculaceae cyanobacterium]
MTVITIREQQKTATGFSATLSFDGRINYPITITEPFSRKEEQLLEWYFEEWLVFPSLNEIKAQQAAASIQNYGQQLFEQVFKTNFDAYGEYRQLRGNLGQLQIEIESNTPEFQALHWESIHDPELPRPLAVDCVMLRKMTKPVSVAANIAPSPVINLLVVIARLGDNDASYRTISRPLIELIEATQLRIKVELLRPGTYEALERHLEEKGAGFYHIIHFDTHGALMKYQDIEKGVERGKYVKKRYGRGNWQSFEGVKAFLALEADDEGVTDLVEAQELANLLTGKGIPVCFLNACQSGKQVRTSDFVGAQGVAPLPAIENDSRETSLGSRLMSAGMQMVVAMGYSVTVTAASLLMQKLYQEIFAEKSFNEAIRLGRRELFNKKQRQAYHNQTIDLEDWLLPVVYSNGAVNLNLREFTAPEEETYLEANSNLYEFTPPLYGFVGRDLEILKIERSLIKHNILLLQGMGGTGKTTLLTYLQEWWQTTNFAEDVFYFGYDEQAWTLEQIVFDIGKQVYGRFEQANFQAMNSAAQVQKLVTKFRAEPYILILDNLESVTGQQLAIQNTLPENERNKIRDFLKQFMIGKTRVVLGSRSCEEWLQKATRMHIYQLQGLDPQSRSVLAEKILKDCVETHRIPKLRKDDDFKKLLKLLAGYPLAMEVVLANLRGKSPSQILADLQAADVKLDNMRETGDKTESILKCVEYSHSNLSPDAQKLLLCLAPFSGFIFRDGIPNYIKELQKLEPFQDYAFEQFDAAIQEAINWGLLSGLDLSPSPSPSRRGGQEAERLLVIQPIFPYFLNTKLNQLDEATRAALREGFKNHCRGLAGDYYRVMKSNDADMRQLGIFFCKLDYENLYKALTISLEKQETIDVFFCLDKYFELVKDIPSNLKLSEEVCQAHEAYPSEIRTGRIGLHIVMALERLAYCYLQTQAYQKARDSYQKVLQLYQELSDLEEREKQRYMATTLHNLGRVAQELREFEQAKLYYQQALDIKIEFGDRYSQANTLHQLGIVAQLLREFEQAKHYYQQALDIYIAFSDRYSQADTLHQLGRVAEELREYEQAKSYYQQALDIDIEDRNRYSQASTLHQLGIVAQKLREYEQAQTYYQQALDLKIEYSDRFYQASTLHHLGMVAQELREYEQAQTYYQQALDLKIEYSDRYSQASTYFQLGRVAEEQEDYPEARANFEKALEIFVEYKDEYYIALTRGNLERI